MPILKKLPGRSKSCHDFPRVDGELILPRMDLNMSDLNDLNDLNGLQVLKKNNLNPFDEVDLDEERNEVGLIMGDLTGHCRDGEEEENELNAERHGAGNPKGMPLRGTLERICGVSPIKTLGKLGKGLRFPGRKCGTLPAQRSLPETDAFPPVKEKRKGLRRSSEEIMTLLR